MTTWIFFINSGFGSCTIFAIYYYSWKLNQNKTLSERTLGRHCITLTWGLFVSSTCKCRKNGWKKKGAKLKWTLLSVVICSNFPRNSERKLAHRIANAHDYQEMLWTESNLSISSGKRTRDWAAKTWGAEGTKSSHILSPHLAPASPFVYHSQVTPLDIP